MSVTSRQRAEQEKNESYRADVGNYLLMGLYDRLNRVAEDLDRDLYETAIVDLDCAWEQLPPEVRVKVPERPSLSILTAARDAVAQVAATNQNESAWKYPWRRNRLLAENQDSATFQAIQKTRQKLYDVLSEAQLGIKPGGWQGWNSFPSLDAQEGPKQG